MTFCPFCAIMDRLTKFLLKDILNGGGIGFAFRFFHDLPDQEAESFGFTGAVVGLGLLVSILEGRGR